MSNFSLESLAAINTIDGLIITFDSIENEDELLYLLENTPIQRLINSGQDLIKILDILEKLPQIYLLNSLGNTKIQQLINSSEDLTKVLEILKYDFSQKHLLNLLGDIKIQQLINSSEILISVLQTQSPFQNSRIIDLLGNETVKQLINSGENLTLILLSIYELPDKQAILFDSLGYTKIQQLINSNYDLAGVLFALAQLPHKQAELLDLLGNATVKQLVTSTEAFIDILLTLNICPAKQAELFNLLLTQELTNQALELCHHMNSDDFFNPLDVHWVMHEFLVQRIEEYQMFKEQLIDLITLQDLKNSLFRILNYYLAARRCYQNPDGNLNNIVSYKGITSIIRYMVFRILQFFGRTHLFGKSYEKKEEAIECLEFLINNSEENDQSYQLKFHKNVNEVIETLRDGELGKKIAKFEEISTQYGYCLFSHRDNGNEQSYTIEDSMRKAHIIGING